MSALYTEEKNEREKLEAEATSFQNLLVTRSKNQNKTKRVAGQSGKNKIVRTRNKKVKS